MPEVSVVLPAYESHETIASCLEALRAQTFRDFETIVVDSSPTDAGERIVREGFPETTLVRSRERLFPHAARARGVERAKGRLIVSADPDVIPDPDWLSRLVAAHLQTGHVVVGALECDGGRWLDRGVHLCKFGKWLPAGPARPVDMAPTANVLLPADRLLAAGGFPGHSFLGDVTLSWRLAARGEILWFEPAAVVRHRHLSTFGRFLAERLHRGRLFADVRVAWRRSSRLESAGWLLVTVLPLRLASNLLHAARQAARAGQLVDFLTTFPVVAAGFAASLLGEASGYAAAALSAPASSSSRLDGRGSDSS